MGLFGHKKHVYVFWCRFNDAEDIKSSNDMVHMFGTKEVALTIQKVAGKSYKPGNMRILNDLLVNSYSKPLTQSYVNRIMDEAWKILTSKFHDELFDKSNDVPISGGAADLTKVPGLEKLGLFLLFVEA